ncbi:MAG TPA: lasso peptide biosynthesis B2 protein [Thermoanaerobaculia bacterium]
MPRFADRLLLEALLVVPLARVAVALLPFRVVHRMVDAAMRRRGKASQVPRERIAATVARVARGVPGASCLTQVVAAALLSARYGHEATLRLGVTRQDDRVAAHAWLESEGRVILGEPEPGTFVMLGQ